MMEESLRLDDDSSNVLKVNPKLFDEIEEKLKEIKGYQMEETKCREAVEKIDSMLEPTKAKIEKAKQALDALRRRNEFLQTKLEDRNQRVEGAIGYWKDFGLDAIKQISENHYDFTFTKPVFYSVSLRYQDDKLEIVDQTPELIAAEEFNESLRSCVQKDHIDYKLAVLKIKKKLAMGAPKISSRQ